MSQSPNFIFNSLPQNIFAALKSHLKNTSLKFGEIVAESEHEVKAVYFPHDCVISLVVDMEVGDMIETAMVGRDGVANATSALDGKISLHKAMVQVAGNASVVDPDTLRSIANEIRATSFTTHPSRTSFVSAGPTVSRMQCKSSRSNRACAAGCYKSKT